MPERRHRRRSIREKSQMRHPSRWWMVGFLLATLLGGGIGYVALLGDVANSRGANFFMTPEGARLLAVGSGAGVGLLLVGLLFAVIYDESRGIGNSRRALFWCSLGILTVGIVGSLLGSFFLPKTLPIPLRVLFGAFIGLFGLGALIGVLADPKAALGEALFAGLEGCCSHIFVFFIALTGLVSGLLLWHTLLLGVLAGGGAALVTVILFTGLALTSRKEEVSHGSKTYAPKSLPVESGVALVECPDCGRAWTLSPSGGVLRFKSHDKRKMNTPNTGRRWARKEGGTDWNVVGGEGV